MKNFKHNFVKMDGALLNPDAEFHYGSIMMYPPNMGTLPTELRSWVKINQPRTYEYQRNLPTDSQNPPTHSHFP